MKHINRGPVVLAVMREAADKFGVKPDDPGVVARWIQLRIAELMGETTSKAAQPQLFDDEIAEPEHRTE